MEVTGRISVEEQTVEELSMFYYGVSPSESVLFSATMNGVCRTTGSEITMSRSAKTPSEAIDCLMEAMAKAGINWTLEE